MAGHPHTNDNKIDLGVLHHGIDVVEGVHGVELCLRGLGGVLVGRTDRLQCIVRQEVERWDVGVSAPAAAAAVPGRTGFLWLLRHLLAPLSDRMDALP